MGAPQLRGTYGGVQQSGALHLVGELFPEDLASTLGQIWEAGRRQEIGDVSFVHYNYTNLWAL